MNLYAGIDVQVSRPCPYFIADEQGREVKTGWLAGQSREAAVRSLKTLLDELSEQAGVFVGLDCPRCPLPELREWYWKNKQGYCSRTNQSGYGRHCEVVVSALKIANPQWTPLTGDESPWMELGFDLFRACEGVCGVYEVFPSASYTVLRGSPSPQVTMSFSQFRPGPKDMLDAVMAAVTVREFVQGRGCEVGGGDGLGTIILPSREIDLEHPVHRWPVESVSS